MSLQGRGDSLAAFSKRLRELPRVVGQAIAEAAAPALTDASRETFGASEDAYGDVWDPGADGSTVTLRKTGALANTIRYVAVGTKLRVALGTAYAKFQVGKRPIFPRQGDSLPDSYVEALERTTNEVMNEALRGAL